MGLTLGIYAVTGRLVTAATVAAVLTILGLLDERHHHRVRPHPREHAPHEEGEPTARWSTSRSARRIVRSINTSITALLPVVSILLFGGVTLKDFAFALVIGIVSGTYSSIFVASPLW